MRVSKSTRVLAHPRAVARIRERPQDSTRSCARPGASARLPGLPRAFRRQRRLSATRRAATRNFPPHLRVLEDSDNGDEIPVHSSSRPTSRLNERIQLSPPLLITYQQVERLDLSASGGGEACARIFSSVRSLDSVFLGARARSDVPDFSGKRGARGDSEKRRPEIVPVRVFEMETGNSRSNAPAQLGCCSCCGKGTE